MSDVDVLQGLKFYCHKSIFTQQLENSSLFNPVFVNMGLILSIQRYHPADVRLCLHHLLFSFLLYTFKHLFSITDPSKCNLPL